MSFATGGRCAGGDLNEIQIVFVSSCSACSMRTMPTCSPCGPNQAYLGYPDPLIDTEFVADDCPQYVVGFG
jgi:hypothetical protein